MIWFLDLYQASERNAGMSENIWGLALLVMGTSKSQEVIGRLPHVDDPIVLILFSRCSSQKHICLFPRQQALKISPLSCRSMADVFFTDEITCDGQGLTCTPVMRRLTYNGLINVLVYWQ